MTIASVTTFIERARARTGLDDFGPDGWQEGYERLAAAMAERDFGAEAEGRIEARFVDVLATRLRIEDWIGSHPELLERPVDRPVFIMGLPRTGTTAMQAFLSSDPQWRYLRDWEAADPVPPPDAAQEARDPRLLAVHARNDEARALGQNVAIHEAGGPVDDLTLLRLDWHNQELGWPAWSYTRWWRDCDMTGTYAYHARGLRYFQSRGPLRRWLVKAPWHNFHIETLAAQYPDVKFVMCHRDPASLIPSVASVVRAVHRGFLGADAASPEAVGRFVLEHLKVSIARVMAFREKHGADRFVDVLNPEFAADPFGTLERIYAHLGAAQSDEGRAAMTAWLDRNRKGAHGEHKYTAQEFGLDRDEIRAAFRDYLEAFGL